MKLIDSDKILEALGMFTDEKCGNPHFMNGIATVLELIEDMPEAVVRCIDCKYMGAPNARGAYGCKHSSAMVDAWINGYCSYGTRRNK